MEKVRNKRTAAGWIAIILSFAVLIGTLSVGIYYLNRENRFNRLKIENLYQESMFQMSESLSNVETNMSKLMVSNDDTETALLLNDTYHHSQAAMSSLNNLPINPEDREVCDKFLNQLGDWCTSQCKAILGGVSEEMGDEQIIMASQNAQPENQTGENSEEQFLPEENGQGNQENQGLESQDQTQGSQGLESQEQNQMQDGQENQGLESQEQTQGGNNENISGRTQLSTFDEQCEELFIRTRRLNAAVKDAAGKIDGSYRMLHNLSDGLMTDFDITDSIMRSSTDASEIIYDGPFSDSKSEESFKGLEDKEQVTARQAIKIAQEIFKNLGFRNVQLIGESTQPDAYSLYGNTNEMDKDLYVSISKNGGVLLLASLPCDNSGKMQRLEQDKAIELAQNYAAMCGYEGLSPVWYHEADMYSVVNLTPEVDGVIHYPDLVKVKVCMVTGDFAGIEATGYCKSHCQRDFSASIDQEEASKSVSSKLNIYGVRLAVVPKDNNERLCYEFAADYKGLDYFIYVDANSGAQVNILRVIDSDQGQMLR